MKIIRELLARDLNQRIEEIIQVDQTDEQAVYTEIREYVATERIKDQYNELFKAIASAPTDPHESIGVWVSGFFGSGKSSFAKNVGYVLSNQLVVGHQAGTLFKDQVGDEHISELVDYINVRIPTKVIMFDVSKERAVKKDTARMAEIMYTILLRELDYAEDYDIADLEIELEKEARLEIFKDICLEKYGSQWRIVRKGAMKISRASAILHEMEPQTFPTQESWAQSLRNKSADITVSKFVERTFELCARRLPGKALTFIIDEVGQYVARSTDKIEDLRAVVEQFGKESRNRLKANKIVAPIWVMVTSQEKLDEVVSALDSKRVELAKLQDRFRHRIDMAPADIREVATRRVLAKTVEAETLLGKLYQESQGRLNIACHLERTTRNSSITQEDFIQFYPYLPHFIELSIDIVSGIRLQTGANKHIGGSNRTIIKQAYEMLVSDRTAIASMPIGTLVTFDKIFDLVEGNLSSEKQKDVSDIRQRFKDDSEDLGMATRVAKALCLLEFVRDLPRTDANIAACLVSEVGKAAPLAQVKQALEKLRVAQFVRNTEDGWKMQTAQEKNWDTERRAHAPRTKDRNVILRESLLETLIDKIKTYRYRNLRSFRIGLKVDGVTVGEEGQIPLLLVTADDSEALAGKVTEVRNESRQAANKNALYWIFALTGDIDGLIVELYASRQMVNKYSQLSAQNRITQDEGASLAHERNEVIALQRRLREKMMQALEQGQGLFQGMTKEADTLGKNIGEMLKTFFDFAVPTLYPKLEMGVRELKGDEVGNILKSDNLSALPQIFYPGSKGLNLVVKEDTKYVPNPEADIAREVLNYLNHQYSYGEKVTGKGLDEHFQGIGYGWERDVLRLVLATLLRAGSIEVIYQGRRYRNHQDHQCREAIESNTAFKSAAFVPRKSIELKTLTTAVQHFEDLTGNEVDVEEGAIATAFKKFAEEEEKKLFGILADAKANDLPVLSLLEEYQKTLENILTSASDDCIRFLTDEGKEFKETRNIVRQVRQKVDANGLAIVRRGRNVVQQVWPVLMQRGALSYQQIANELSMLLQSAQFFEQLDHIAQLSQDITTAYQGLYLTLHEQRATVFGMAIAEIKGRPEWSMVQEDLHPGLLKELSTRLCRSQKDSATPLLEDALTCQFCNAMPGQIDSDVAAVESFKRQIISRIRELTTPVSETVAYVERVRLADFFDAVLESDDAVDKGLEQLSDHLHKKIAAGAKIIVE